MAPSESRSERRHNPIATDLFEFDFGIRCDFTISNNTRYQEFYLLHLPPIPCKSFFSQEGHLYLWTHLSKCPYSIPDYLLDDMVIRITNEVQQLYSINDDDDNNLNQVEKASDSQPRVFLMYMEIGIYDEDDGDEFEQVGMTSASKDAIESLETFDSKVLKHNRDHQCCVICMDEFDVNDNNNSDHQDIVSICTMPCNHVFHQHCIVLWLQTSHMCPLCRYPMPTVNNLNN